MSFISPKEDFCFKELFSIEIVRKGFISDVLSIPMEDIKSVRLLNTFLWKRFKKQKQGILDVVVELNDNTKINIEIQTKVYSHWDKRSLFYLSKLFTEDLKTGKGYSDLKKCIHISILDFNLTDRPIYHSVYRLRDTEGNEFTDLFELHIIELRKQLNGTEAIDNWIRFFNAESKEDLKMIRTKNVGLQTAIEQLREISLTRRLRLIHEAKLKEKRDRRAQDDYVRNQGMEEGREEGREEGIRVLIQTCHKYHVPEEEIILQIEQGFSLTHEEALKYYRQYNA